MDVSAVDTQFLGTAGSCVIWTMDSQAWLLLKREGKLPELSFGQHKDNISVSYFWTQASVNLCMPEFAAPRGFLGAGAERLGAAQR